MKSPIVDARGHQIDKPALNKEQTAQVGSLRAEFANHPSRGLTPRKLARILEDAERGDLTAQCDLFEDMEEKDGHIFADMSKRKRVIMGLEWDLVPPREPTKQEEDATQIAKDIIMDMPDFEDHIFDMADAIGKGFSNLEISWKSVDGFWVPELTHRPQRWFTVAKEDRNKILLRKENGEGEALWPMGWVSHVHKAKSGYVARSALFRVLSWLYLFKNYSVRDLAQILEVLGIPVRIGTYPAGASEEEKLTLLDAVINIGHNAAGIIPEGMMIDMKAAASGSADPFQAMIDWCEAAVSKAILGGTLTTMAQSTGLGSGLGDVQNEVRNDIKVSDSKQISGTVTRDLVWPIVALNAPGVSPRRAPRHQYDAQEAEDMKLFSESAPGLVKTGMRIAVKWAHEKLKIPQAEEGEPILTLVDVQPTQPEPELGTAATKAAKPTPDTVDQYTDRLTAESQPGIDNMLDTMQQLLDDVDSLEEFRDRLLETYNHLDPDELSEVMQLGLSAADLAGRYEGQEII